MAPLSWALFAISLHSSRVEAIFSAVPGIGFARCFLSNFTLCAPFVIIDASCVFLVFLQYCVTFNSIMKFNVLYGGWLVLRGAKSCAYSWEIIQNM